MLSQKLADKLKLVDQKGGLSPAEEEEADRQIAEGRRLLREAHMKAKLEPGKACSRSRHASEPLLGDPLVSGIRQCVCVRTGRVTYEWRPA